MSDIPHANDPVDAWLQDLRALLGKTGKAKKVFSLGIASTVAEDIEKRYRSIEALLAELRLYRDETSDAADLALLAQFRERVSACQTEAEFKQAAKDLGEFEKRLKQDVAIAKKEAGGVAWGKVRHAVMQDLAAAAGFATPAVTGPLQAEFARIDAIAATLAGNEQQAQGPQGKAVAGQFAALRQRIAEARKEATSSRKGFADAHAAAAAAIAELAAFASPATIAAFTAELQRIADAAGRDHDSSQAADLAGSLTTRIAQRKTELVQVKAKYVALRPVVRKALDTTRPDVSEQVWIGLHESFLAIVRNADAGNLEDAHPQLVKLQADLLRVAGTAIADQQRWQAHPARKAIPTTIERLLVAHMRTAPTLLNGMRTQLQTIEHVAATTHDFARACAQIDALAARLAEAERLLRDRAPDLQRYETERAAYAARWRAAGDALADVAARMQHVPPKELKAEHERLQWPPLPTGAIVADLAQLQKFTDALAAFAARLARMAGDPADLAAYTKTEFDAAEIAAQRRIYMDWRPRFQLAVERLQTFGGADVAAATTRFAELEQQVQQDDLAAVTAAAQGLNRLHDEISKAFTAAAAEVQRLRTELRTETTAFDARFDQLSKVLQKIRSKDAAYDYRQSLREQAADVANAAGSMHRDVLGSAIAKMKVLRANLDATADDKGRAPILAIQAVKAAIAAALADANLVKHMPRTRERLVGAQAKVLADSGGTTPPERAQKVLDEFRAQVLERVAEAQRIAALATTLTTAKKELTAQLEQLSKLVREIGKQPANKGLVVKGTDFGELGARWNAWCALASGELAANYEDAETQLPALRAAIAAALKDPAAVFAVEQQNLAAAATADKALAYDKERFALELRRYENVDLKAAKDAVAKGGDKDRLAVLATMRKQLDEFLDKGDLDGARARLSSMVHLAQRLATDPQGGRTSPNLRPLGERWRASLAACKKAATALAARIDEVCTEAGERPDGLDVLLAELPRALGPMRPEAFDAAIATLLDSHAKPAARQGAREQGLDAVREYQRHVDADPLLRQLAVHPFGVTFPVGALYHTLSDLRLNLEISD